jgi:hypothetical protein
MRRTALIAFSMVMVFGANARGQADSVSHPVHICWARVHPAPRCSAFILTEIGVEHPMYTTHVTVQNAHGWTGDYYDTRFMFGTGLMINSGPMHAAGVAVAWDNESGKAGPSRGELRFRTWRGPLAYDLSIGAARFARGVQDPARGLTGGIGVEGRRVAADIRVDWLDSNGQIRKGLFATGRLTSFNAPLALIAGGLVAVLIPRRHEVW